MNDESGVLIEGYELSPMILQPWHPPYYRERLSRPGMTKAMDLLMWDLEVEDRDKVLPVIWELAEKVEREHGIRVRPMRRLPAAQRHGRLRRGLQRRVVEELGLRPVLEEGSRRLREDMQLVFDKHWFMIAEKEDTGEVVGDGDHDPRRQPGAGEDERQAAAARLVALPQQEAG